MRSATNMTGNQRLQPEIYPLTGIRAVAAMWVVIYHLGSQLKAWPRLNFLIAPVVGHGYLGVDLFFILSGFIIHYNYAGKLARLRLSAIGEFLWMRLARLWPVHAVLLVLFALLIWGQRRHGIQPGHPEFYTARAFLWNVLLVQSWSIPMKDSWNVPAWSISCEWLAYLVFPFLVVSRLCTASVRLSAVVAALALVATALVCQIMHPPGATFGVVRVAGEFLAGCALCHVFQTGVINRLPWDYIVPLAIVALLVVFYLVLPAFGLVGYCCVPFLGLIVLGLAYDQGFIARLCSTKLFLFGGYLSYSVYMVHNLCFIILKRAEPWFGGKPALFVFVHLFVTFIAALLMFYFVERPCRKAMQKALLRHKQRWFPTPA
jgi:peptidoglycan/LPS O-acetylase OafA/YrhL